MLSTWWHHLTWSTHIHNKFALIRHGSSPQLYRWSDGIHMLCRHCNFGKFDPWNLEVCRKWGFNLHLCNNERVKTFHSFIYLYSTFIQVSIYIKLYFHRIRSLRNIFLTFGYRTPTWLNLMLLKNVSDSLTCSYSVPPKIKANTCTNLL